MLIITVIIWHNESCHCEQRITEKNKNIKVIKMCLTILKIMPQCKTPNGFHINHRSLWLPDAQHDFFVKCWRGVGGQLCITSNIALSLVVFLSFGDQYSSC